MLDKTTEIHEDPELAAAAIAAMDAEELRGFVRHYAEQNSTSLKSIGLLCGITGESTFTAWLSGKYKGDVEDKTEKVRRWAMNESQIVRIRNAEIAKPKFVMTRAAKQTLSTLQMAQALGSLAVVCGGAGVGKTSACETYKETNPNVWLLTAEPLLSGAFAMIEYLREVLGIPQTAPHKLSRAISTKVAGTKGLIIVDEAQHLETKAVEQLRAINDRCGIGLALVGTEDLWSRIDGGGRKAEFAQLFSRVGRRLTIARPSARDIEILLDACEVFDAEQRKVLRGIAGKAGAMRSMWGALQEAQRLAAGAGEALTAKHILTVWSLQLGRDEEI